MKSTFFHGKDIHIDFSTGKYRILTHPQKEPGNCQQHGAVCITAFTFTAMLVLRNCRWHLHQSCPEETRLKRDNLRDLGWCSIMGYSRILFDIGEIIGYYGILIIYIYIIYSISIIRYHESSWHQITNCDYSCWYGCVRKWGIDRLTEKMMTISISLKTGCECSFG